jgi:hypothetical protein
MAVKEVQWRTILGAAPAVGIVEQKLMRDTSEEN